MSIFDNLTAQAFKTQFPRFTPQFLSDITYSATKTYFKDDIVYYEGEFFICIKQSIGNSPRSATYWKEYNDSVLNYTQDSDIQEAIDEASLDFNKSLFPNCIAANKTLMFLVAHYLTIDFKNALGTNQVGMVASKSVGSVSESYTVADWIMKNPALAPYATTGYGIKYCSLIRPYLIGNVFVVKGSINAD